MKIVPQMNSVLAEPASKTRAPVFREIPDVARDGDPAPAPVSAAGAEPHEAGVRDARGRNGRRVTPPTTADEEVRFRRVMAYARKHFRTATLSDLAKVAGASPFHFHRRFTHWAGRTPKAVLAGLQVEHAQALMAEGRMPLATVAAACGFAHQSHFTSRFVQLVGTTPGRWRRDRAIEALLDAADLSLGEPRAAAA